VVFLSSNSVERWLLPAALCAAIAILSGCSGRPGRVSTPKVNPNSAAQQAVQELDKNSDGQLSPDELKTSPPLLDALPSYDVDHNASLSQREIADGISRWSLRGIGALALPFTVRFDGRPLEGAQVKLVPAPFLDDAIRPATGVADRTGSGSLNMAAEDRPSNAPKNLPLIQPGLYTVEITHPSIKVPAKYNSQTTLGLEASVAGQNPSGVTWSLTSK
jgi:hypothetical protein